MSRPPAAAMAETAAAPIDPGAGSRPSNRWPAHLWPVRGWGRPRSVSDAFWLLASVVLIAICGLRLAIWTEGRSLWLDEEMIAGNLRSRGFGELSGALSDNQAAPLGWLWLERATVGVFGYGEHALRLVPMMFGIAATITAYAFGRRWLNGGGTLVLVILVGLNAANVNYSDQVKHYSSDMFWVLLLVAVAFWALYEDSARRWLIWWGLALVGSWLSMGAILIAPALTLVILGTVWRRHGLRAMLLAGLPGVAWLASFAVLYLVSLRDVTGSAYLTSFWEVLGYPSSGSGPLGIVKWFARHLPLVLSDTIPLSFGLTSVPVIAVMVTLFCALCVIGAVVAFRRRIEYGLVIVAAPVSAVLLAVVHKVPLSGRLALWMVPALLVAAAFAVDAAVAELLTDRFRPSRVVASPGPGARGGPGTVGWSRRLAWSARARRLGAVVVVVTSLAVVVSAGTIFPGLASEPTLDDRAAIAAMVADHRPGDLTLFVGSALEAQKWYDPADRLAPARVLVFTAPGPNCSPDTFSEALTAYQRVVVYAGVRFTGYNDPDVVVPEQLARVGQIVRTSNFGTFGIVWVVDLSHPAARSTKPLVSGRCLVVV